MESDPIYIQLDHLVVAARTLEEGVAWVEARLGVPMGAGGKHALMSTHNRVLNLGERRFLEVIAIDPEAPPPGRARWFSLDEPQMAERLAKGPALIHWVARSDDIERAVRATAVGDADILSLSRGPYRWRMGVPGSGRLAQAGIAPTMIQWESAHPCDAAAETGCRLERLVLRHPDAARTLQALRGAGLREDEPVEAREGGAGPAARIRTPKGIVELRE
jgi:hypothetical protein